MTPPKGCPAPAPLWRDSLYLGPDTSGHLRFAVPVSRTPGVPNRANLEVAEPGKLGGLPPTIGGIHGAARYWLIRDTWRSWPDAEFAGLVATWQPQRDKILARQEYRHKSQAEWLRFYTALDDERDARLHARAGLTLAFGIDGRHLLDAMAHAAK